MNAGSFHILFYHSQAMALTSWFKITAWAPTIIPVFQQAWRKKERRNLFPIRVLSENCIQYFHLISIGHVVLVESWVREPGCGKLRNNIREQNRHSKWRILLVNWPFKEIRESESHRHRNLFYFYVGGGLCV